MVMIGCIICFGVLAVVLLYNTMPSRTQMIQRHRSGIKFIEAKANYFNARADSLSYLKTCTPESDAMMDIADSITSISSDTSSSIHRGSGFKFSAKGSSSSSNSSSNK